MLNNPINTNINLRKQIAEGEEKDRKITLQLQTQFKPISEALWQEKQNVLYLNTLRIRPTENLSSLLANELENKNQNDPVIVEQISRTLLLQITDKSIVDYIIERLSSPEQNRMNQFWPEIIKDLKKRNLKLNKQVFVEYLKRNVEIPPEPLNEGVINQINEDIGENNDNLVDDNENEDENRKKRKKGQDEYDILLVEDEEGIRPFSIGDIDTRQYISNILSRPEIPDMRDKYFTTWLDLSEKLKNKSIKKSQYIGYIERRIDRNIPNYLTKKEVMKIAMYVGYSYEIDSIENPDENRKVSGGKMKKKKRIVGKGISQHPKKIVVNKFSVNMEKLKNNILSVQYTSCRGSVPSMKIERISNDVKSVITDILENQYNSKLFDKLLSDDQRIISNFVRTLKIPNINMDNFDKKYQHEYEVLLGEVRSGNDNEQIKKKLKQYILRGISENLIPRAQGLNQILNL